MRIGVDVGGTFTDLVALVDGRVVTAKVPSTPRDQSEGVMSSVRASGVHTDDVRAFAHGMTVATNALLERRGARTALVTTAGFADVIEIGRQNRPSLYDLTQDRPPALVPRDLRFTVAERMGPDGEIEALDEDGFGDVIVRLKEADVEAVAVCLLFAFMHPDHERHIGEVLRRELDGVHVSLSSEVLPEFREYERFSTTVADAYLGPKLGAYLDNLGAQVEAAGMPAPLVMQSTGGVIGLADAARGAAACVLSGPAAGVVGAAYTARASGFDDLLTFDMGGTSTDVAPVTGGAIEPTTDSVVAGVPIRFPMVDVHTVSAGGGSVGWVDAGGALRVGPHSAGADPGPAAYGREGEEPTITDANLALGYLADGVKLGGEVVLHRELAVQALERLGEAAGMDALEAAHGMVRVANAEMVRALRVISVERGLDPRSYVLVSFGGAGPMHACALAEELGMTRVLVPRVSGVLSALGLAVSDVRRDYVSPWHGPLADAGEDELDRAFHDMETTAASDLEDPELDRRADLRYERQSFELTVDASDLDALADRWHDVHEQRYGYRMEDEAIEVVSLRLIATVPVDKPELDEGPGEDDFSAGTRRASFDDEWHEIEVFDRTLMGTGSKVEGPAIVELAEATCVIRPGWRGAVDDSGTLVLERS